MMKWKIKAKEAVTNKEGFFYCDYDSVITVFAWFENCYPNWHILEISEGE